MSNLFMFDSDVVWCRDILIAYSGELLKIIDSLEPLSLSGRWVLNFYVPPVEVLTVVWPKKLVLRDVWLVSNNICINVYRTIWTVRGAPYFIIFSSSSILLKTGKTFDFVPKFRQGIKCRLQTLLWGSHQSLLISVTSYIDIPGGWLSYCADQFVKVARYWCKSSWSKSISLFLVIGVRLMIVTFAVA